MPNGSYVKCLVSPQPPPAEKLLFAPAWVGDGDGGGDGGGVGDGDGGGGGDGVRCEN